MYEEIIQNVLDQKMIAIVRSVETENIVELAEALYAGGINMMEVTFNQACTDHFKTTAEEIALLAQKMGDRMYVGSGTCMTREQVDLTWQAGGQFIVTPNVDPDVISYAREKGLVTMPGAFSPTEAQTAHLSGADFVKIFPAGNMGPSYIRAIKAPLAHIRLLAVGGVNEKNIRDFLDAGCAGAGVGGNLVNKEWIRSGSYDKITALAKKFVAAVN